MDRRTALAAAAAVACTLVAGSAAVAANTGLPGGHDDNVGELTPVTAKTVPAPTTQTLTLVIDQAATPAPQTQPAAAPATAQVTAASYDADGGSHEDQGGYEHEEDGDDD